MKNLDTFICKKCLNRFNLILTLYKVALDIYRDQYYCPIEASEEQESHLSNIFDTSQNLNLAKHEH